MPDWEALVCRRLAGLALGPGERREVIEELAAHFDETYEELRGQGFTEEEAVQRALCEVKDWHELRRRIRTARRKKNTMSNRVTQFWVPGLLTFLLSVGFLVLFEMIGPKPWILATGGQPPLAVFHITWFLSLPLLGAMGACLSSRTGGSKRTVFTSIVFPVLPFLASVLVVLTVSLIFDHFIAHSTAPMALLVTLLGWVLVPGVALLAGGLPVHLFLSRRLTKVADA